MAGRTNYVELKNTDPMNGPAQINAVAAHFDALAGEARANLAALPTTGNWPGRTIFVEDIDTQLVWAGSSWKYPIEDTGWVTATNVNLSGTVSVRRVGNTVHIRGKMTGNVPTGSLSVASIPGEFRPGAGPYVRGACDFTGGVTGTAYVTPGGTVGVSQSTGATRTNPEFTIVYLND